MLHAAGRRAFGHANCPCIQVFQKVPKHGFTAASTLWIWGRHAVGKRNKQNKLGLPRGIHLASPTVLPGKRSRWSAPCPPLRWGLMGSLLLPQGLPALCPLKTSSDQMSSKFIQGFWEIDPNVSRQCNNRSCISLQH